MVSFREKRVREIVSVYYSRKDVQEAIFEFSQNREVLARYFESYGKRPDSLQYKGDVFQAVKKGATSFHCSEELWKNPLEISTNMKRENLDDLRMGWDLVIDIDSKYLDFSKVLAEQILNYITEKTKPLLLKEITKLTTESKYLVDFEASKEVIPDIILVSSRHLFRMPYSLHEKTSLASVVLNPEEISKFQPRDANPLKVSVRNFLPDSKEGEATENF